MAANIKIVGSVYCTDDLQYYWDCPTFGCHRFSVPFGYEPMGKEPMGKEPQSLTVPGYAFQTSGYWAFRGHVMYVSNQTGGDDIPLLIKVSVLRKEKAIERVRSQVASLDNVAEVDVARRERITDRVRQFVWQRDSGKCAKCGSLEKLEFDHIIPVVRGGSNTERNLQLLCERCNREKGANL